VTYSRRIKVVYKIKSERSLHVDYEVVRSRVL
jgi:hypothetical protein